MHFLTANLKPLFIASLVIALIIMVMNAPQPQSLGVLARPVARDTWQLPELNKPDTKQAIQSITARNLWGIIATGSAVITKPQWRYAGTLSRGAERFVLIMIEGKPTLTLKEKDELPDGSKIVSIEDERFFVLVDGQKRIFGTKKE